MGVLIYGYCHIILSGLYINLHTKHIQCNWKKTQPWLHCHYKFTSVKNMIFIFSNDIFTNFNSVLLKIY